MKMHPAVSCSNYGDAGRRFIDCVYPAVRFLPAEHSLLLLGDFWFYFPSAASVCDGKKAENCSKQLIKSGSKDGGVWVKIVW